MQTASFPLGAVAAISVAAFAGSGAGHAQGLITVQPPQRTAPPEERPVSFSQQQADAGRRAYRHYCVTCHGDNLDDGEFGGPPLRGNRFESRFGGLPLTTLYSYIETAMPPDRPGRLSSDERVEIIAYILSRNGYDTGRPMPDDYDAMSRLLLEK